jgi:uncharacterized membrane protein YccC
VVEVTAAAPTLDRWVRTATPLLLYGLRLWAAVCLALFLAFWLELDNPSWAGTSAAIVCQPVLGASMRKGWFRLIGTVIGAIAAVVLSACFPQHRAGFLLGLAFWGAVCALIATLLRNFASYSAALAGFTAAIIVGDELGAVGGPNGDAFQLAVARTSEICIGIVCAGAVLATTDLGGARQRLATLLAGLSAEIAGGLVHAVQFPEQLPEAPRTQRRRLALRLAGLGTVIDQAAGEISNLPLRPRAVQAAADSLFDVIAAWRLVATHLEFLPAGAVQASRASESLPNDLINPAVIGDPTQWQNHALALRATLHKALRRLLLLPTESPSLRLIYDSTAEGFLALGRAATGVLLIDHPWLVRSPRHARLRVPDLLPALINAMRAFLTIAAASLIWIWTAWPSGATFITFAVIAITMFTPQEDAAYAMARTFTAGSVLAVIFAALIAFALLPQVTSFWGFCVALGLVLVPAGALAAQPWQQGVFFAIQANFIPLLSPSNPSVYDPPGYYNSAMAILGGIVFAMLAMRLMPPMPPAWRARRLLALTLRDLRRLTHGKVPSSSKEWESRTYSRLSVVPESVDLLQAGRLAAALSVGKGIIRLRRIARRFGLDAEVREAMDAIAAGRSAEAIQALDRFDRALAALPPSLPGVGPRLRARATTLSVADALTQHASYFDAKVPA